MVQQQKHYKTRSEARGIELPFTTVKDGIEYGQRKVAEYMQQKQEEIAQAQQSQQVASPQQAETTNFFPGSGLNLEDEEPLNFNEFLEEYEQEIERNMELDGQSMQQLGIKPEENDELDPDKSDDLDLDDDLDDDVGDSDLNEPSSSKTKKRNDKKKSNSKNRSDKQSKKKSIKVSRNQQRNTRDRAATIEGKESVKKSVELDQQQKDSQQRTKKVITARNTEIVAKNDYTGQKITRTTENIKDQKVGGGKDLQPKLPTKAQPAKSQAKSNNTVINRIAEAKLLVQVNAIVQTAAMITHQTGRPTEFKVGKDTLQFKREGQDTFALKNGEKVPIDVAHNMLKSLGHSIGERRMEQITQIVKVAQQNPAVKTLSQDKVQAQNATHEQQKVKTIKVHGR